MEALQIHRMKFKFVPLQESDLPLLHEWLNRKHVADKWDGPQSLEEVGGRYGLLINSQAVFPCLVYMNEAPIGYIQSYNAFNSTGHSNGNSTGGWWTDQPEGTWGVDQFIADENLLGMGLGSAFVKEFTDQLLNRAEVKKVITDPAPENAFAIRAYEKAGFIQSKIVQTPDGPAMLMEKFS